MGEKETARAESLAKAVAANAMDYASWSLFGRHEHRCYVCDRRQDCEDPDCAAVSDDVRCDDCWETLYEKGGSR
jgi:hypothetical protein